MKFHVGNILPTGISLDDDEISAWTRDCIGQLKVEHENEAFLKFVLLASILGYRYAAYGLEYPTSAAEPPFSFFANFVPGWQEKFVVRNPAHHGSRVAYGKRTIAVTSDSYYWSRYDFMNEASANRVEFTRLKTFDCTGGTVAMIGVGSGSTTDEVRHKKTEILLDLVAAKMEELLIRKNMPQLFVELSDIERTYLLWVLDGKTGGEIADIMGIAKTAVDTMARKLPERFDRRGVFATAFLAWRIGLLDRRVLGD